MRKLTRRGAAVGAALAVIVAGGGAAWAWQIFSASASATAQVAAIKDLSVQAGPSPVTGLYPTGAVDLVVTVQNDNSFPVRITSLAVDRGNISADNAHVGVGCTWTSAPAGVSTTRISYTPPSSNRTVPPHGQLVLTFANAVIMGANAPTACAGAVFTIPVEANGETP